MSFYADYITERTNDKIIENENGFIVYRYLNNEQVYIVDIFVRPEFRKLGLAKQLADQVCNEAKEKGCKEIFGTANPACKGANDSLLVLIAYGMAVYSCSNNLIVFKKGL